MNIYFVDGILEQYYPKFYRYHKIDAKYGISSNLDDLDYFKVYCENPENKSVAIVTNCTESLSTEYGWDTDDEKFTIFLFRDNVWYPIDRLTNRILRYGDNIRQFYIDGEFGF